MKKGNTNNSIPIEYKILEDRPLLILKRKKGEELTVPCPFCGNPHKHSKGDGHRAAHCATDSREWDETFIPPQKLHGKEFLEAPDGTFLFQQDGYIIITKKE